MQSPTTYRLFDWNRVDAHGQPRALHILEALEAVNYDGPVTAQTAVTTDLAHVERLASCDKFILDRWNLETPQHAGGDDRFHIISVIQGQLEVRGPSAVESLGLGETVVLPAASGKIELRPAQRAILLDMYLP